MAAIAPKKAGKKKASKSPLKKVAVKPSGKTKKTVPAKRKENIILPAKKPAATKPVAKKTTAKKPVAKKTENKGKPQEKTGSPKDRLLDLKKALISKKANILKEVKEEISRYVSGDNKQLVDTANDEGDWAQIDISEDLSLQRLSAHRKIMYNIDEAVRKIEEGTYGICEDCGEEISEKRLLVLPAATLCVDCQENREELEKVEKDEL